MLGIKGNVEDVAAAFKKMAIINPERHKAAPGLPEPESKESEPTVAVAVMPMLVRKIDPETAARYATTAC